MDKHGCYGREVDVFGVGSKTDIPKKYHRFIFKAGMKSKYHYPYTYDPFLIYFNKEAEREADRDLYTDRLLMWDNGKHNLLCKRHFGNESQYWHDRDPKKIEAFLCDWTGKKVVLVVNIQYVNLSSGYPVWYFGYYIEEKLPDKEKNASMRKTGANNANENSKT